ncbi:pyridoxal phosphate-dependent aminotransferase [bacterium]
MKPLSNKSNEIQASITLAISAKAKMLKSQGISVIGFGAGEPDFDTPDYIKQAGKEAIDNGFTRYTASSGIPELKKAICEKFQNDNNLTYAENQIIVSCGAKHSLFNTLCAICNEGDEVIIIAPYWVTYLEQIKFAGAKPVILESEPDFSLDIEKLSKAINSKTKALIINSPSNPTGAIYDETVIAKIAELAIKNDIYVISDEIYEEIIYDKKHVSIASLNEDIKKRTIVINGVSKSFAMTGWRIGYAAAEKTIIDNMNKLQSHSTSNAASIAQKAAVAALTGGKDAIKHMLTAFKERRDYIVGELQLIEGIKCNKPEGAFYAFPDVSTFYGKKMNDLQVNDSLAFANALLNEEKVAVVPGSAFGNDKCVRFSYALGLDDIKEGIKRFKSFIQKLN